MKLKNMHIFAWNLLGENTHVAKPIADVIPANTGEPKEIAATIEKAVLERLETTTNEQPRKSYERYFSNHQVKQVLIDILSS
ncbi:MAG: hypothetical protein P1U80_09255 [Pseudomonadales bacterium]|nr:hypothetical protein [Pseudomonadales bacterium]